MIIKGDALGFDKLEHDLEDAYFIELIEIGKDAIKAAQNAHGTGGKPKEYLNHTWNLRNAPGACVVRDGKIIWMEVAADGAHPEARSKTENLMIYSDKTKDGLYLCDGMEYASYVSSKGYDVLDSAVIHSINEIEKL